MHVQIPAWQVVPDGHFIPHLPQLFPSFVGSTQSVPQTIKSPGQVQTPFKQVASVGQAFPHPPQLPWSLVVSTQAGVVCPSAVHIDCWPGHAQTPSWHESGAAQARPHMPQLLGSFCRKTHCEPQTVHPPSKNMAPVSGGFPSGAGGACMSVRLTTSRTVASCGELWIAPSPLPSANVESRPGDGSPSGSGTEASPPCSRSWKPQIDAHAGTPKAQPIATQRRARPLAKRRSSRRVFPGRASALRLSAPNR